MAFIKLRFALLSVSLLTVISGCVSPGNSNSPPPSANTAEPSQNQVRANSSGAELGMLINFTLEPEDLAWREDQAKNSILAVFRLNAEETKKLADQLGQRSGGAPKDIQVEDWFPAELIAQGETYGGSSVEGNAFPADDFYQPPYSQGTVTRVSDTNFFVIELSRK